MGKSDLPRWLKFVEVRMRKMQIDNVTELSHRLGVTNSTIANWWYRKNSTPPTKHLSKLAKVLDCKVEEIVAGKLKKGDDNFSSKFKKLSPYHKAIVEKLMNLFLVDATLLSSKSLEVLCEHKRWLFEMESGELTSVKEKESKHLSGGRSGQKS